MKFESKIGIGEICVYNDGSHMRDRRVKDFLVKVSAVWFDSQGVKYQVENVSNTGLLQHFMAAECDLLGDPDFDQEAGKYTE